jgi:predicted helicase
MDELWRKAEKFAYLEEKGHVGNIAWQELQPDAKGNWLTYNLHDEFDNFVPLGSKMAKAGKDTDEGTIFKRFSNGVKTNRDAWVYNFGRAALLATVELTSEAYNKYVYQLLSLKEKKPNVSAIIDYEDKKVSWSSTLITQLQLKRLAVVNEEKVRVALYRPFSHQHLYYDGLLNDRPASFASIFPTVVTEKENRVFCATGVGAERPFASLVSQTIPDLNFFGPGTVPQWYPFYIYNEDGTNRRENITDWALEKFRTHYGDESISKWDIFHYVYAVLHHPLYRERYAANLKRELPRVPYAPDFRAFASAGARLAELHVNYERQPEYALARTEQTNVALDYRVERMKLDRDAGTLRYNHFLTLSGIPPETFDYRLGNRSALEWVVDQYQVSTDRRSGITNDPNRPDDPEYILRLVGQVVTVSLETGKLVRSLPSLGV